MSFVLGVALASLSTYFFPFLLLPAGTRVIMGLLFAEVWRVWVVLADGRLMDSVGLFQWKFPIIWYWSGSLEWSFYHSFTRLIKDFLFLSGNCISRSVFLIRVLHQSATQCRFVVLLERFTSGDEVSHSGLLAWPSWTLGKTFKLQFPSIYHDLFFWLLLELLFFFFPRNYLNKGIPFWTVLDLWVRVGICFFSWFIVMLRLSKNWEKWEPLKHDLLGQWLPCR